MSLGSGSVSICWGVGTIFSGAGVAVLVGTVLAVVGLEEDVATDGFEMGS